MIKRILAQTILLFALYNLYLYSFDTYPQIIPNYTSDNIIKAESYIYSNHNYPNVIVGSSLSSRLNIKNGYNLSFIGEGPLTGLDLLKHSNSLPEIILLETNYIPRNCNKKFIEGLFSEPMLTMKSYVPAFLEKNQLIVKFLEVISMKKNSSSKSENYNRIIEIKKNEYNEIHSKESIKESSLKITESIKYFRSKNVKLVLLTIPIDSNLRNSRRYLQEMYLWDELSKSLDLAWIHPQGNFITSDGEHLIIEETKRLSLIVDEKLSQKIK